MGRVLLVEDESIIAMMTEEMLADLGFKVGARAATLYEGLKVALEQLFDLAVLDIDLRGEFSYPIADVLSERGIPFVFVSACAKLSIAPRFRDVPALDKPFSHDGLQRVIAQVLG